MLAAAPGGLFHGIALVVDETGGLAAWSHREGAFAREVTAAGHGRGPVVRLGPPCDGGLAAARDEGGFVIACLARAMPEAGKSGGVTLSWLGTDLAVRERASFGSAGRYALGVSLAVDDGDAVVAWQDGTPGAHRVFLARIAGADADVVPRLVSRPGLAAGAPSLVVHRDEPIVAWAETWFDDDGYLVGQVLVSNLRGAAREMAVIIHDDARPVLALAGESLLLGYRDEHPAGTRPRLFLLRVSDALDPIGEPVMIGRANGIGGPSVVECEGAISTIAPRSYGRWDVLVGLNRFDARLERIGVERQIYEYGADFSFAAAACAGDHLLVLTGERGNTTRRVAELGSTVVDCR